MGFTLRTGAPIDARGNSSAPSVDVSGITINSGDLVIVSIHFNTNLTTGISADSDSGGAWNTGYDADNTTGNTHHFSLFWKIANGSEPSSYSFTPTPSSSQNWQINVHVYQTTTEAEVDQVANNDAWATSGVYEDVLHLTAGDGETVGAGALSYLFGGKDWRFSGSEKYTTADNSYTDVSGDRDTQATGSATRIFASGGAVPADIVVTPTDGSDNLNDWTESVHISFIESASGVTLAIADAGLSVAADSPVLTQSSTLTAADALHSIAVEVPVLTQANTLVIAEALLSQAADNVDLTQASTVAIASALLSIAAETPTLTQSNTLSVAEALLTSAAENVGLTQKHTLAIFDALQSITTDNVSLTQKAVLAIADVLLSQTSENLDLSTSNMLSVADALLSITSDAHKTINAGYRTDDLSKWWTFGFTQTLAESSENWSVVEVTGAPTSKALQIVNNVGGSESMFSELITVEAGHTYEVSCYARQTTGLRKNRLVVDFYDSGGGRINVTSGSDATGWPLITFGHYYHTPGDDGIVFPASWTNYGLTFGPAGVASIPSNAVSFRVGAYTTSEGTGETTVQLSDYRLRDLNFASIELIQANTVAVADALLSVTTDPFALTQKNVIAVADAVQSLTAENIEVVGEGTLVVAEALLSVTTDPVALTQKNTLAVANALQSILADAVSLTQKHALLVQDASLAMQSDNAVLSTTLLLSVADALLSLTVDTPSLVQKNTLAIADALLSTTADSLNLVGANTLLVANALLSVSADNIDLTQKSLLVVQEALLSMTVDQPLISPGFSLELQDALLAIGVDSVALNQKNILVTDDALLTLTADNAVLSPRLIVSDALMEMIADTIVIGRPPEKVDAIFVVDPDDARHKTLFVIEGRDNILVVQPRRRVH